ncbi:trimeric intracellular cation channel family protein [Aestuariicella hydrocarbonica]|uniref:Trimeric intracellular cation channel family protein n=1 Tax=Pseudomaricurvus hydrocarbonicus TaxID=1470433 RepID=A0A9E5JWS8_9GAMM|nr:trimeric intracellular cation channel family protein [Aestuariicella hydrocarbonica]NHO66931.1 trimeric intracellular cation channel family protein [Aestuariicella hydrocarbonica]
MLGSSPDFLYIAGLLGVIVFAISGALAAAEKHLDILGFILFAAITGIGGGTVRDLILGVDVFWVTDALYLQVCVAAGVLTYFLAPQFVARQRLLLWMDAMGLALFSVLGTSKAYALGVDLLVACAMGMITTTFGSVIRDILSDREPVLLGPEIYVTAALAGAMSYLLLFHVLGDSGVSIAIAVVIAFAVRAAAMVWDLRLPKFSRY